MERRERAGSLTTFGVGLPTTRDDLWDCHDQDRRSRRRARGGGESCGLRLALAQFVASYVGSNMNVAISSIDTDLDTAVTGIQTTITLYVDHGGVDDPGQQVDRHLASQVLLPVGTRHLRRGALLASFVQGLPVLMIGGVAQLIRPAETHRTERGIVRQDINSPGDATRSSDTSRLLMSWRSTPGRICKLDHAHQLEVVAAGGSGGVVSSDMPETCTIHRRGRPTKPPTLAQEQSR